jgi:ankyrin repeat protein
VSEGKDAMVKLLIKAGAGIDVVNNRRALPLNLAVLDGHAGVVEVLLSAQSPTGARLMGSEEQAVHQVAWGGHLSVAKLLVNHGGCDWDAKREDGCTPLHLAAMRGHEELIKFLLDEVSANIDSRDKAGATALHAAVWCGATGSTKVLIEAGALLDATTKNGSTPLHFACWKSAAPIVRLLLDKGSNLAARMDDGRALPFAASF